MVVINVYFYSYAFQALYWEFVYTHLIIQSKNV